MNDTNNDNRFEIIGKAKKYILKNTNIETSPDEMKVLDNFLFRCWQMGLLNKFNTGDDGCYMELFAVKDGIRYDLKSISMDDASKILVNGLMDGFEKLVL